MNSFLQIFVLIGLTCPAFGLFFPPAASFPKLEKYNVDPSSVTVSGISSGGAMSSQMHYTNCIYSSMVKGAGIFAAGPYLCGADGLVASTQCLQNPTSQNVSAFEKLADSYASSGKIDALSNIKDSKVYIFHGLNDIVVKQASGKNLRDMYQHYGANIKAEFDVPSGHGQPVDGNGFGGLCSSTNIDKQYVNECGYNGAYELFSWLYGPEIVRPAKNFVASGQILKYDQNEFNGGLSMAGNGIIYVPSGCKDKTNQCKLHVAFHGCMANEKYVGTGYVTKTQYAEVAELNNIIVLFPQTSVLLNPQGCWDWFGYTGPATYGTKSGAQPSAVYKMIKRVTGA